MPNNTEAKFPSEVIELPSKGYFYPKENKLSSGKIELKYMTAKEEDILTSQNLIKKGIAIDRLIESLIVDKEIDTSSLLVGDKNAIMVASRILGYGSKYDFELKCPNCGEPTKDIIELSELESKEIDTSKFKQGVNEFEFTLPISKRVLTFKLLTQKDQQEIDADIEKIKKLYKGNPKTAVSPEVTTRFMKTITAVDGDEKAVNNFVKNEFLSQDSLAFREHLLEITPDIDLTFNFVCGECEHSGKVGVPLGINFFWPSARK